MPVTGSSLDTPAQRMNASAIMNGELEDITQTIRQRRSIKPVDMDAGKPVDRGLLMELLENANHAPTHGQTEPWRFHIFQGEGRRTLAQTMARIYQETTPANEFREDKMKKMSENPLLAGAVVAIGMARRGGAKIPEVEEIAAVACAVQNLALSATAAGLAGYWSSPPLVGTRGLSRLARNGRGGSLPRTLLSGLAQARIGIARVEAHPHRGQAHVAR